MYDVDPHRVPEPAVVLLMNGEYGLRYFTGPVGKRLVRGLTREEAYAKRGVLDKLSTMVSFRGHES